MLFPAAALAGPPFVTDDPVPVDYRNWEVYFASQSFRDPDGWSGTLPHLEVNYGLIPNMQLHLIAPMSYSAPFHAGAAYGYGDTELGIKYRFFEEKGYFPDVGVFPLLEVPTGDADRGLGGGHVQAFFPIWLQKTFGKWTTYGGGGYWINPGKDNQDWWFAGWEAQRQITSNFSLGAEIFHETAKEKGGDSDTKINIGGIYDFNETYHLLFSAGPTIQGPSGFQGYIALQLTFGPKKEEKAPAK